MAKKKSYGKTAGGVPISDELIEKLSKEAEAGYDVEEIVRRRPGRPSMGSAAARVESVRLDPELRTALANYAERLGETTSDVIRSALRALLSHEHEADAANEMTAEGPMDRHKASGTQMACGAEPCSSDAVRDPELTPFNMREVSPRTPDPEHVFPPDGADQIITSTFLLELPFSLRVPDMKFVVSHPDHAWEGWGSDEIGHLIGVSAKIPDGYGPQFRIAMNQTSVRAAPPLRAACAAFPEWVAFPKQIGQTDAISTENRTAAMVSVYTRLSESPVGTEDDHEMAEWLSRRFDEALGILNDYLVVLAAMHDEWHISRISRADLPRKAPFHLDIRPSSTGSTDCRSTLDVHATIRDDLPPERDTNEVLAAVELVKAYREGRAPLWEWIQYYQAAEHHLGSGRYDQAVIAATTAMEVMVSVFFREIWEALELDPDELSGVLQCGFKNQLTRHLPNFLDGKVELTDPGSPPGLWYRDCYLVRNSTVHEGKRPSSAEAMDAKIATRSFVAWIGHHMEPDERTAHIKASLSSPVGERRD